MGPPCRVAMTRRALGGVYVLSHPRNQPLVLACFTQLLTYWPRETFEYVFSRPTILLQLYGFLRRQHTAFRVQGSRLNPSRKTPTIPGKKQSVILTSPGSLGGGGGVVLRPREMAAVRGQRQTSRDCLLLVFRQTKKIPLPAKPLQQALMSLFQAVPLQTREAGGGRELRTKKHFLGC